MSKVDDKLLLSLTQETYLSMNNDDKIVSVEELRFYYDKRHNEVEHTCLKTYLDHNEINYNQIEFINETQCFRLKIKDLEIDFPSNLSCFESLKNSGFVYLDETLDEDHLLDIFSELRNVDSDLLMLSDHSGYFLVFFEEASSKDHLNWIRDYLEKKQLKKLA